ncbi:MAG: hypothetical protein QOI71_772 [Gaiellales bacterium]|nr:hypothetical protein [Gaiellales bacterium]
MRKLIYAAVALTALVATSIAVADGIHGAKSAKRVAGTFNAALVTGSLHTRTCTTADTPAQTIVVTDGEYKGVAGGDADLTGAITLRARSIVNTTTNVGVVSGHFKIDPTTGRDTKAKFLSVYDTGTVAGLAVGKAHQPNARLIANLSATFVAASGFTGGKLGGGTAGGSAVELGPGSCKPAKPVKPTHPASTKSEAHGVLAGLTSGPVVVSGLTCAIPPAMLADVNARFHNGDMVQIHCTTVGSTTTLTKIDKKH